MGWRGPGDAATAPVTPGQQEQFGRERDHREHTREQHALQPRRHTGTGVRLRLRVARMGHRRGGRGWIRGLGRRLRPTGAGPLGAGFPEAEPLPGEGAGLGMVSRIPAGTASGSAPTAERLAAYRAGQPPPTPNRAAIADSVSPAVTVYRTGRPDRARAGPHPRSGRWGRGRSPTGWPHTEQASRHGHRTGPRWPTGCRHAERRRYGPARLPPD